MDSLDCALKEGCRTLSKMHPKKLTMISMIHDNECNLTQFKTWVLVSTENAPLEFNVI